MSLYDIAIAWHVFIAWPVHKIEGFLPSSWGNNVPILQKQVKN